MTKHAVRLRRAISTRVQGDQGQGALEYVGILIIVGVIVAALVGAFTGVGEEAAGKVTEAVEKFLSGG